MRYLKYMQNNKIIVPLFYFLAGCTVMEDVMTLVLIIVLCLLFKPLISAVLRGLGSSEHRRDR